MDRNKVVVIGVLVLLVGALAFMRLNETPPTPPEERGATSPTPVATSTPASGSAATNAATAKVQPQPDVNKLQKTDLRAGKGKVAKTGDRVEVHYRGTLTNGTKFDASYDRGQPFQFTLGAGEVIRGWDEGVAGMKEGGKRKLVIPPDMGYGPSGQGPIPPNATLIFEIELLRVLGPAHATH